MCECEYVCACKLMYMIQFPNMNHCVSHTCILYIPTHSHPSIYSQSPQYTPSPPSPLPCFSSFSPTWCFFCTFSTPSLSPPPPLPLPPPPASPRPPHPPPPPGASSAVSPLGSLSFRSQWRQPGAGTPSPTAAPPQHCGRTAADEGTPPSDPSFAP